MNERVPVENAASAAGITHHLERNASATGHRYFFETLIYLVAGATAAAVHGSDGITLYYWQIDVRRP